MMLFSNLTKKRFLTTWFIHVSLLLLVLSGCSLANNQGHASGTPGTATFPPVPTTTSNKSQGHIRPFIDTWNGIHLFQGFDYDIDNPASIGQYYDFVWGASPNKVADFRSSNPNVFLSFYISFFRDSGTFSDQTAKQDLSYWQQVHPDWILYQCDRRTPAYEDGLSNVPFNFTNPAVISWEVQTYAQPASENGYDALAADNVNMENLIGACGYYKNGQWVQRYSGQVDDPQWRSDVVTWITSMQNALRSLKHPLALIPNFGIGSLSQDDPQIQQVLNHVDGVLDESGFTDYGQGYLTGSQWVQTMHFIESVQQSKKAYFVENEFPTVGKNEIQWALASYLMCKEHTAAIAITPIQGYGTDLRYNEYNAKIGSPVDPMREDQHVYWRTYTHGLSVVNPSPDTTYTITLPDGKHFVDLYGHPMAQQVTMSPHSGLVLLSTVA